MGSCHSQNAVSPAPRTRDNNPTQVDELRELVSSAQIEPLLHYLNGNAVACDLPLSCVEGNPEATRQYLNILAEVLEKLISGAVATCLETCNDICVSADDPTITHVHEKLLAACNRLYEAKLPLVRTAVSKVSRTARQLQLQGAATWPHMRWTCCSSSMDALMNLAAVTYTNKVTVRDQNAYRDDLHELESLLQVLGFASSVEASAVMGVTSKALLYYLTAHARHPEKPFRLKVRRDTALRDAMEQTHHLWLQATSGRACAGSDTTESNSLRACGGKGRTLLKFFPQFYRADASDQTDSAGVEQGEGHGPRKELFLLLANFMCERYNSLLGANSREVAEYQGDANSASGREALETCGEDVQPAATRKDARGGEEPLFVWLQGKGTLWFNVRLQECAAECERFRFAGWLIAQALLNYAVLGTQLAPLVFEHLMRGPSMVRCDVDALCAFDSRQHMALQKVLALPSDEYSSFLEFEELPRSTTRAAYAASTAKRVLLDEVAWMSRAMRDGFLSVVHVEDLESLCIGPCDLASIACGGRLEDTDFKVQDVFHVVLDKQLKTPADQGGSQPLVDSLWLVLDGWPKMLRRRFVEFVTASAHLPPPKTALLKIELPFVAFSKQEVAQQLRMLPQAHTCENLLELPDYWSALLQLRQNRGKAINHAELFSELAGVLEERLKYAVTECKGFDLDET